VTDSCVTIEQPCDLTIDKTCSVGSTAYVCANQNITKLKMIWTGTIPVWITTTNVGGAQSAGPVNPGDSVEISGYGAADKTAGTTTWNIYSDAAHTTQVGQSKFSIGCPASRA
jgi:hypothetical protein